MRIKSLLFISFTIPLPGIAQVPKVPSLRHVMVSPSIESGPPAITSPIRVSADGEILTVIPGDDPYLLAVVDSTGKVSVRFGRSGEGPSEVKTPSPIEFGSNRLVIWDNPTRRLSVFSRTGALLRSMSASASVQLVHSSNKHILGISLLPTGATPVLAQELTGLPNTPLVAPSDTFWSSHFGPDAPKLGRLPPVVGEWSGGFLLADAWKYRIGLYSREGKLVRVLGRDMPPLRMTEGRFRIFVAGFQRQGRPLPPAAIESMRERAMAEVLPQITPGASIGSDKKGRLWVMGMAGDSAFADVFTATHFLGRIAVPCRGFNGSWSLNGEWIAAVCIPDAPDSDADAVLKLFKIREPN